MNKVEEARKILKDLEVPQSQQSDICCLVLLALAGVDGVQQDWSNSTNEWLRIHDIISYANNVYKTSYAENSRETFRKQAIHYFRNAAFIEDNNLATNSPNFRYKLTDEMLELIRSFDTSDWDNKLSLFKQKHMSLIQLYASNRESFNITINVNNTNLNFSTGEHNLLQKLIIEKFAPCFAPNSVCLYIGDTRKKDIVNDFEKLKKLGFCIDVHNKMPDVILYRPEKNWLYFIEAVTSVGPMDPKRVKEINEMTNSVSAGKIFVTAFLNRSTFRKFFNSLAWETEVWIAEEPAHMIHLNGSRFLGPY